MDRWLRDRDLDDAEAAALFACSKQFVNRMRRRFDDPTRKKPGVELAARIVVATSGAVRPEDFEGPTRAQHLMMGVAA